MDGFPDNAAAAVDVKRVAAFDLLEGAGARVAPCISEARRLAAIRQKGCGSLAQRAAAAGRNPFANIAIFGVIHDGSWAAAPPGLRGGR
jgi:hypothetical protein